MNKTKLSEAVKFYTLSANQGDTFAEYNLALMYEKGEGVKKDIEKAIELYTSSSERAMQRLNII